MKQVNADKNIGTAVEDRETEQGFTPGPWQVFSGDRCWHVASMDRTFETGCIMFVGGVGSGEANARLIAAAPALYEIAVRAAEFLCADRPKTCSETRIDTPHCVSCLARAALALVAQPATESAKRPISALGTNGPAS